MARGEISAPFVNFPAAAGYIQVFWNFVQNTNIADFTFSASGGSAPTAVDDVAGGGLTLASGTGDNNYVLAQSDGEFIRLNGFGKTYDFLFRVKLSEDLEGDYGLGIGIRDTDWLGDSVGLSDAVFLRKRDGAQVWDLVIAKDAATFPTDYTALNAIAPADELEHVFAIRIVTSATTLGTGQIWVWVDGSSTPVVNGLQVTNLPHDKELTLMFGVKNGDAAGTNKSLTVYGVGACLQR